MDKIPVSVLVVTKNEEAVIARCLDALSDFDEVIVVDSSSSDCTAEIAGDMGVQVVDFVWNGQYPKKRQWCLDHIDIQHDWVFWVDADEVVPPALVEEIRALDFNCVGYFVQGQYVWNGLVLTYGMRNNKIMLFDRKAMAFPVVDDLECPAMGEIEGHYQPIMKSPGRIGQLNATLLHYANDDRGRWASRHDRYAQWEAHMNRKCAWPEDPIWWREHLKDFLRASFLRPYVMFSYSYFLKFGFLDGRAGFDFARARKLYCDMVLAAFKH